MTYMRLLDSLEAVGHTNRVRLTFEASKIEKNVCCSTLPFGDCVSQVTVTSSARTSIFQSAPNQFLQELFSSPPPNTVKISLRI